MDSWTNYHRRRWWHFAINARHSERSEESNEFLACARNDREEVLGMISLLAEQRMMMFETLPRIRF